MKKCLDDRLSHLFDDPYLSPYLNALKRRREKTETTKARLVSGNTNLIDFASGHEYFGLHACENGWLFREWAPNASDIYIIGIFSDWREIDRFKLVKINRHGIWEGMLPPTALRHGDLYRLVVHWQGGKGDRIPAYARRVVQDEKTKIFNAQVWAPPEPYQWKHTFVVSDPPLIYEAHVGMAQEKEGIGTYEEFRKYMLPRIKEAGYNMIQLMALTEHPYYASFGYHVSSYFAASSRFGTPFELKKLIDDAHGMGMAVIMDLVHSHAAKNEVEGLSRFDGTQYQYFHEGGRGDHVAWGSRCFDYGKPEVMHFLLSNCRFWLDEYHVDGFRFDGVTSMLYLHHGLSGGFNSYDDYFGETVDEDAITYLALANEVVHRIRPDAVTIAEDVSGMPGLAAPAEDGGCGFDYRLAMGVPDCWFKLVNDVPDENWNMEYLWHELVNRRAEEKTISYPESHDQALVGGKTLIFEMADAAMYRAMQVGDQDLMIDRAMALHKMIRLATIATASHGYLNFMGNEFGHPEWIDFPREGNNWSYHYARRQWSLRDAPDLKYHFLADFDRAMLQLVAARKLFVGSQPSILMIRNDDKIMVIKRGALLFLLNFHPSKSVVGYRINVKANEYELIMDTDETRFGGQSRLVPGQRYVTASGADLCRFIEVYLPCRTAAVIAEFQPGK